ncbi:probable carotenoid cleavage dioxygenase 4, chloroplastic [Prosopis cineraria]|uniref:probable carotenoid cleavage dioxygenase 4, chloroplastic n=1 Tax=Prosopis cineraria TaxID=364024 RepID=UPI00240EA5F3|nr:probable carotenoid cleavage dioxygenase 4, chloroplastic [Prosopis cineraria]
MTAHPKVDLDTGEAFAFRYGLVPPFLTYFRFESKGVKQPDVPIFSTIRPAFLHDFTITNKYVVFVDIQIGMNPVDMLDGGSLVGSDPSKVLRIEVLPRCTKDESQIKWFDVPGFNSMRDINAWDDEDGNSIVLIPPNILSVENTLERMELVHAMVEKVKIDLKTGIVMRQLISARNLNLAVINQAHVGKKNKFVYAAICDLMPQISRVVKLDLSIRDERRDCTMGCRMFEEGCYGREPFFMVRDLEDLDVEEDDGYVVTYVHDEKKGESKFMVIDAKLLELGVAVAMSLPRQVPYGFHGLFVRESNLRKLW